MVNSRAKGARGERDAAKALSEVLGVPCRRTQQYCGASDESDDIVSEGIDVSWEVKFCERVNLFDALAKCRADARPGSVPAVLHRKKNKPWLLVIELNDLQAFVRALD